MNNSEKNPQKIEKIPIKFQKKFGNVQLWFWNTWIIFSDFFQFFKKSFSAFFFQKLNMQIFLFQNVGRAQCKRRWTCSAAATLWHAAPSRPSSTTISWTGRCWRSGRRASSARCRPCSVPNARISWSGRRPSGGGWTEWRPIWAPLAAARTTNTWPLFTCRDAARPNTAAASSSSWDASGSATPSCGAHPDWRSGSSGSSRITSGSRPSAVFSHRTREKKNKMATKNCVNSRAKRAANQKSGFQSRDLASCHVTRPLCFVCVCLFVSLLLVSLVYSFSHWLCRDHVTSRWSGDRLIGFWKRPIGWRVTDVSMPTDSSFFVLLTLCVTIMSHVKICKFCECSLSFFEGWPL